MPLGEKVVKVITWNVNSVKMRLARTKGLILRHRPDVLALQELKVSDEVFPSVEFQELGYGIAVHGQAGRNGVALLSRHSMTDIAESFAGDPFPIKPAWWQPPSTASES